MSIYNTVLSESENFSNFSFKFYCEYGHANERNIFSKITENFPTCSSLDAMCICNYLILSTFLCGQELKLGCRSISDKADGNSSEIEPTLSSSSSILNETERGIYCIEFVLKSYLIV